VRLNIRWRLTLWNALALAVVLAFFAALVYALLRRALYEQTESLLAAAFAQLQSDPLVADDTDARLDHWADEFKEHQNLLCVIYRPDGSVQARTPGLADESVPPLPPDAGGRIYDEQVPGVGRHRASARHMRLGGREFVVLLLAPLGAVDHELAEVRAILLTAGPAALLLAAAFGYWLARKSLAPVDRLRRAADAITAEDLGRRLPVLNPDDEFGRLTRTINAMIARLERSFAEVRRFTADASHELRTPLTVLRSEVEVALGKPLPPADQQELLGTVLEELGRMSRLTDQLLTLSRRDAGVEQFEAVPHDLASLAGGVVEALRPLAEAKGVRLRLDAEGAAVVAGDAGRLRQVVINLLDNALKYTPEGGAVTVRVGRRNGAGFLAVEDTGIGIAPEHLPHVFDRFYRVDKARTRAEGGTGLGLSIARSIVQNHGGAIHLSSIPGQGTVCTVTLPPASAGPDGGEATNGWRSCANV
jgi:two-component system heavy metal sensor histidine kinase CusS